MEATIFIYLVIILVVMLVTLTSTVSAIIQLPLIPYHVMQKERRLLLLSSHHQHDGTSSRYYYDNNNRRINIPKDDIMQQIDALYQGYGTHYLDLWVGTPKQRQTVIVGTGSGMTAFPCSGCTDCGEMHHTDSHFIEADSSTFIKVPCANCTVGKCQTLTGEHKNETECRIKYSYVEGSMWSAYESRDLTFAGGPHDKLLKPGEDVSQHTEDDVDPNRAKDFVFELMFGCTTHTTGLFSTQLADGIMGMDNYGTSFWHQAWNKGVIDKRRFSLCLSRQPTASWQGTEAGALTMGGVDQRLHQSPMVYSTFDSDTFFSANVKKIYLREGGGGTSALATSPNLKVVPLDISSIGKVDIDSGTTDTYFSSEISYAFKKAWEEFTGVLYSHGAVSLTEDELNNLPTILFQIEGDKAMNEKLLNDEKDADKVVGLAGSLDPDNPLDVIVAMPPHHYMEYDEEYNLYTARFYVDEWGPDSVLGANAMMGHDLTFDADNNRIGWAESHCDYTKLEEEFEEEEEEMEGKKEKESVSQTQQGTSSVEAKTSENKKPSYTGNSSSSSSSSSSTTFLMVIVVVVVLLAVVGMLVWKHKNHGAQYRPTEMEVPNWTPDGDDAHELSLTAQYAAPVTAACSENSNEVQTREIA